MIRVWPFIWLVLAAIYLPSANADITILGDPDSLLASRLQAAFQSLPKTKRTLTVCISAKVCNEALAGIDGPTLAVEVHRGELSEAAFPAVLYYDPDPSYQFKLAKAIFGKESQAVAMLGPSVYRFSAAFVGSAKKNHIDLKTFSARTEKDIGKTLAQLSDADALIAIFDRELYAPNNWRTILLGSYRHDVPVIGYSDEFVSAGAIASVSVDSDLYAEAVIGAIKNYFARGVLPESNYPPANTLTIRVHANVARSFGLTLDADRLKQQVLQ